LEEKTKLVPGRKCGKEKKTESPRKKGRQKPPIANRKKRGERVLRGKTIHQRQKRSSSLPKEKRGERKGNIRKRKRGKSYSTAIIRGEPTPDMVGLGKTNPPSKKEK